MKRRGGFAYRSVFDFVELWRHFYEPKLLSKDQMDRLIRVCALQGHAFDTPEGDIDWQGLCPELPKVVYQKLTELNFRLSTVKIVRTTLSADEKTCKMLLRLQDGPEVECCIMRFGMDAKDTRGHRSDENGRTVYGSSPRATVCVSSQAGCRMQCTFCATGTLRLQANLTNGEILEQIVLANNVERLYRQSKAHLQHTEVATHKYIRNVVFMGMGEPLDNFDEVVRAIRVLISQRIMALAPSRITVSTVGFSAQRVRDLMRDLPRVSLALSLHAPTQKLREQLVPVSRQTKLDDLLEACFGFVANQRELSRTNLKRQTLLLEYCLIAEVNDTPQVAHDLGALLQSHTEDAMLNVIPYNPTEVSASYKSPSAERIDAFVEILREYKVKVFVRQEFGREIDGACGQLALKHKAEGASKDDPCLSMPPMGASQTSLVPPLPMMEAVSAVEDKDSQKAVKSGSSVSKESAGQPVSPEATTASSASPTARLTFRGLEDTPASARPADKDVYTVRPTTDRPTTDRPTTERPTTDRPATDRPSPLRHTATLTSEGVQADLCGEEPFSSLQRSSLQAKTPSSRSASATLTAAWSSAAGAASWASVPAWLAENWQWKVAGAAVLGAGAAYYLSRPRQRTWK